MVVINRQFHCQAVIFENIWFELLYIGLLSLGQILSSGKTRLLSEMATFISSTNNNQDTFFKIQTKRSSSLWNTTKWEYKESICKSTNACSQEQKKSQELLPTGKDKMPVCPTLNFGNKHSLHTNSICFISTRKPWRHLNSAGIHDCNITWFSRQAEVLRHFIHVSRNGNTQCSQQS